MEPLREAKYRGARLCFFRLTGHTDMLHRGRETKPKLGPQPVFLWVRNGVTWDRGCGSQAPGHLDASGNQELRMGPAGLRPRAQRGRGEIHLAHNS